jgi:hypothetical protein
MDDGEGKLCDVCGKNMTLLNGVNIIGFFLQIHVCDNSSYAEKKALEEQFHPYPVRDYHVCFPCTLKKMGIEPPVVTVEKEEE